MTERELEILTAFGDHLTKIGVIESNTIAELLRIASYNDCKNLNELVAKIKARQPINHHQN